MIIPTLSLWQPWAWAMAKGHKRNETRSWATKKRGWIGIHAAKKTVQSVLPFGSPLRERLAVDGFFEEYGSGKVFFGKVVCLVHVVDCVSTNDLEPEHPLSVKEWAYGDYGPNRFAFITDRVIELTDPVPLVGRQGFFNWDAPDWIPPMLEAETMFTAGVK